MHGNDVVCMKLILLLHWRGGRPLEVEGKGRPQCGLMMMVLGSCFGACCCCFVDDWRCISCFDLVSMVVITSPKFQNF